MLRDRKWYDEEGLLFTALVCFLPRWPTLAILHSYQRSHRKSDRIWATEYLTEFEADDTKAEIRRWNRDKGS
jgi:hypothetical protein